MNGGERRGIVRVWIPQVPKYEGGASYNRSRPTFSLVPAHGSQNLIGKYFQSGPCSTDIKDHLAPSVLCTSQPLRSVSLLAPIFTVSKHRSSPIVAFYPIIRPQSRNL